MKKFITIYNTDFLELEPKELKVLLFMLWHRDRNKANKDYASTAKIAQSTGISQRSIFNALNGLSDKGWIDRVNGDYYLVTPSMSLMIDVKNENVNYYKHEDRSKKSYLQQPHIREAFKQLYPDKQVDRILDEVLKISHPVSNWHAYAQGAIRDSKHKRAKKAQKLELKEGY